MYLQHFQFTSEPFSIAPDPRFLFLSVRHEEALAHLLYGLREGGGFVALTGEVGTGKTTLCHCLMGQLPDNVDLALVLNPKLSSLELIATICDELGIIYPDNTISIKVLTDALNQYLLNAHAKGRRTVVLIDEAQNLSLDVLEQIRLLTNLETKYTKLLQIILVGQPELNNLLNCKELRQLSQRITGRYHLIPLDNNETRDYILHRLAKAGGSADVFSAGAIRSLYQRSQGIPRLINTIADRSLLGAFSKNQFQVSAGLVNNAANEILNVGKQFPWRAVLSGLVLGVALVALVWVAWNYDRDKKILFHQSDKVEKPVKTADEPTIIEPGVIEPAFIESASNHESSSHQSLTEKLKTEELTLSSAFNRLFSIVGLTVKDEPLVSACDQAKQQGYACLIDSGNWRQILHFDRPAILELESGNGQKHHVVLSRVEDNQIQLDFGENGKFSTDLSQLVSLWNGHYVLLWKIPGSGKYILREGDVGESVIKLRKRMAWFDKNILKFGDQKVFDEKLTESVKRFQTDNGLVADGVVGPKTWILLSNSTNSDRPRLIFKGD